MSQPLPHSLPAEDGLISCIFVDADETLERCAEAQITRDSFYDPKRGVIFEHIQRLHEAGQPVEVHLVAEELKKSNSLEMAGGYATLMEVSNTAASTAQASYFVQTVRDNATRRQIIKAATRALEEAYQVTTDVDEFVAEVSNSFQSIAQPPETSKALRTVASYELPPEEDPNALLGKYRYLVRGDGAIIVSSSGMGKSVMTMQWVVFCALGRPMLGIETARPLRSLVIQSEDSEGDMAEMLISQRLAMKLTEEQWAQVNRNVVIVTDNVSRGTRFLSKLKRLTQRVKPDLVWINPLHAFAGCDISDAEEMGRFLREGLNMINREARFAYMLVHHTPKPMTGKSVPEKKWHEFMYDAAGSAELVNWARAVITIKPTEEQGEFNLILAKRGMRAGVTISLPGSGEGIMRKEPTIVIPCRHSSERIKIEGRSDSLRVLHWVTRKPDEPKEGKRKAGATAAFSYVDYLKWMPAPDATMGQTTGQLGAATKPLGGPSPATWWRNVKELVEAGFAEEHPEHHYRRTKKGEQLLNDTAKKSA